MDTWVGSWMVLPRGIAIWSPSGRLGLWLIRGPTTSDSVIVVGYYITHPVIVSNTRRTMQSQSVHIKLVALCCYWCLYPLSERSSFKINASLSLCSEKCSIELTFEAFRNSSGLVLWFVNGVTKLHCMKSSELYHVL